MLKYKRNQNKSALKSNGSEQCLLFGCTHLNGGAVDAY